MTEEQFDDLFTREALRPFQPKPGSIGLTPMLEVHTPTSIVVYALALDGFNDWNMRQAYLQGLGTTCAHEYPSVEAVRFGSEAWMRTFTEEENAARGDRLVETYDDKTEHIVVFGRQATGALRIADARVYRRPTGKVERLGTWRVVRTEDARMRSPLLEAFWRGYKQGKSQQN